MRPRLFGDGQHAGYRRAASSCGQFATKLDDESLKVVDIVPSDFILVELGSILDVAGSVRVLERVLCTSQQAYIAAEIEEERTSVSPTLISVGPTQATMSV